MKEEYFIMKEDLGRSPSRVECLTYVDEEKLLYNSIGKGFINLIETTSMSKTYKMPVLLAFYNNGNIKMEIKEEDVYKSFYGFYHQGSNKVDMLKDKSTKDFESWDKNNYVDLEKRNPVKFLLKTHGDFFIEKEGVVLVLREY